MTVRLPHPFATTASPADGDRAPAVVHIRHSGRSTNHLHGRDHVRRTNFERAISALRIDKTNRPNRGTES